MAINLFRKPGDPYDPLFGGPIQSGVYSRGYNRNKATAAPVAPTQSAAPAAAVNTSGYTAPSKGATKYGVGFGTGLGGDSATQQLFGKAPDLAGLWAMGFDQSDPGFNSKLKAFHTDKITNDADYKNYVTKEAAKNNWDLNTDQGRTYGADWYYRDLARRMGKSNSFLDSTIGKILNVGAQVAAAFIPGVGPYVSAAIGATTGGITGGFKGAVLGGIGGYGIGKGVQYVAQGGLTSLFSKSAPIIDGTTAASSTVNGVSVSVPSTGAATAGPSLLSKAGSALKGAVSSNSLNTAATVTNAGLGIRDLLVGGAAAGAGVIAAQTLTASSGQPSPVTPAPAAATPSDAEMQREREIRRRRITETSLTWGNTLLAPSVRKPTLLGGATKLAA